MARLIHLSDLHFGAHDPKLVEAVVRKIDEVAPDLVVVSGDFTDATDAARLVIALNNAWIDLGRGERFPGNASLNQKLQFGLLIEPLHLSRRIVHVVP